MLKGGDWSHKFNVLRWLLAVRKSLIDKKGGFKMGQVKLLILVLMVSFFVSGIAEAGVVTYYEAEDYAPPVLPTDPGSPRDGWQIFSTGCGRSGTILGTAAADTVAIPLTLALPAKPYTIYNVSIQSKTCDEDSANLDFSLDGGITWDTTTFRGTIGEAAIGSYTTGAVGVVTIIIQNIPYILYDGCDYIKIEEVGTVQLASSVLTEIRNLVQALPSTSAIQTMLDSALGYDAVTQTNDLDEIIELLLTPQGRRTSGEKSWNEQ